MKWVLNDTEKEKKLKLINNLKNMYIYLDNKYGYTLKI